MSVFTGNDRQKIGSEYDNATDAQASIARVEPLITVDQLKERYLFGIPLVAALPDPITKIRAVFTDDMLKDVIRRAVCSVEAEVGAGFHITPVEVTRRMPFDRAEYKSFGYMRLPDTPILRVLSLKVKTSNGLNVYDVPLAWLDPGQFKKGQINLIPLQAAWSGQGAGYLPSADSSGGAFFLSILSSSSWIASYWEVVAIVGMDEGRIPLVLSELIGLTAAIDVLGKLAATYRVASYSTSLDAAGQSVSTPGVQLYDGAIARLEKEKDKKLGKIKARYFKKIFSNNL